MSSQIDQDNTTISESSFEEFLLIHQLQLKNSCVPQIYWQTLFNKLKDEVFDAGGVFQVQIVEHVEETYGNEGDEDREDGDETSGSHTYRVVVSRQEGISCIDEEHIYLVDHAWTYRQHEARAYLEQVAGLKERMADLMDIKKDERPDKDIIDEVLREMWRFNGTYSIGNYDLGTNERLPVWYVMDEFGSRIQHSDMPTFKMAPFMYGPRQIAYSIIWPIKDLNKGEEVTRDYVPNIHHPERRAATMLPWIPHDFRETSFQQQEPSSDFFSAHRIAEKMPEEVGPVSPLPSDRRIRVCLDYPEAPEITHPRFEMVDTGEEADIIWTLQNFKDFTSLCSEGKYRYINQFPNEQCITVKDLLPIVCRRAGTGGIDPDTLEGSPKWLPLTFNLNTELDKFVSYFQHRQDKGLDNVWILKPWNLSNSADITVSDNLNQIIACKYISDCVTIHRADLKADVKVDFRFLIFLASVKPLQVFLYRPFSVRRGHKEYSLTDFDDLLRHLTYVGLYKYNVYRPGDSIHTALLELFQAATSRDPPAGLVNFPLSRAIYGIDLLLQWQTNEKGERYVQPMVSEVNFGCDYKSWMEEYPEMLNDAFSALFFNDIEGREDRVKVLAS
ncbi:TTL12-like protein [Mya arenaria]|uniref:TTL12-like protein n=1 Tax=Mya arenaria TaxID=6604 RepID=A0ABY7EAK6_MYAAR|nr:TTL12-like protein [Mya arenaria]